MKKILTAILSAALLLAGCSASADNTETTAEPESQSNTNVADTTLEATGVRLDLSQYSAEAVTWGPGNITNHERPADPTALQKQYAALGGRWLLDDDKEICLTFDEGYENGYTAQILDTLKEKNVKAIFFCTYDYVEQNAELVQRMIDEGHIVGNHSYRQYNFTEIDLEIASDEITILHDYVSQNFGYEMKYFRFPEGAFSEQTLALACELGYETMFWSFAYADWDTSSPPEPTAAFEKITSSVHNGAVILLHAVSSTNAEILGDVIDDITEQGYIFTAGLQ